MSRSAFVGLRSGPKAAPTSATQPATSMVFRPSVVVGAPGAGDGSGSFPGRPSGMAADRMLDLVGHPGDRWPTLHSGTSR